MLLNFIKGTEPVSEKTWNLSKSHLYAQCVHLYPSERNKEWIEEVADLLYPIKNM